MKYAKYRLYNKIHMIYYAVSVYTLLLHYILL